MVLDVMLSALTEHVEIVASDTTEQWYYANRMGNDAYSPNRTTNPLFLTPSITVLDTDSETAYNPVYTATWQELNEATGAWGAVIVNTTEDVSRPYVVYSDGRIKVNKNVPYSQATTLLCTLVYDDPRDPSVSYTTSKTITLATNRDATIISPVVSIVVTQGGAIRDHSTVKYNPFRQTTSQFVMNAKVQRGDEDITSSSTIQWYACDATHKTETLIDAKTSDNLPTFLSYVSGQGTTQLTVDALFSDRLTIIARVVDTTNSTLYPTRAYRTVRWEDINADCFAYSPNGGAVRDTTEEKEFDTIVNLKGTTLTAAHKEKWFAFDWMMNEQGSSQVKKLGFAPKARLSREQVRQYRTTHVYYDAYFLGNYDRITYNGQDVTYNGDVVAGQVID